MKKSFLLSVLAVIILFGFAACNNIDEPKPDNGNGNGNGNGEGEVAVLYKESFGNAATAAPWPAVADYTGFKKEGLGAEKVTYTSQGGLVTIRSNQASKDYEGASGECNAMAAAGGASLIINDIATCGATNLSLSFGSIVVSDTLQVSYKINGTTEWKKIDYTKTDGGWGLVKDVSIILPTGTNTIKLKFDAAKTQYGTRIDDISLTTKDKTSAAIVDPDTGGEDLTEISISDLRALNADEAKTAKVTIPAGKKIIGIVISDGENGNSVQNNLQIVSENNDAGIMVRFSENQSHGFVLGDKVEIDVSGQSLEFYKKLLQINGVPMANAKKLGSGVSVVPASATIAQITENMDSYESRLVLISNVLITNSSNTYSGNSTINDGTGSMTLYTRPAATFASTALPAGSQNITAFVTRYDDTNQVSIRNLNDVVPANPNATILQITSSDAVSVEVNTSFSHTFTTQESNLTGTTVISCDNLPSWLSISDKTINGTAPASSGTYTLNIVATNNDVTATQVFTINVTTPTVAGENLLINPSFENYTEAIPAGWSLGTSPNNAPFEKITSDVQDGSLAVKIAGNADGRCDLKQSISGIVPGKTYVVSFWYKDNTKTAGSSGIRIWANFTKGGNYVAPTGDLIPAIRPGQTLESVTTWTKYEVEVVAPADVDGFNFEIRATKNNSGIIDNCSFSEKL
ncbi:MAG: hypothetical protein GX102_06565 [Porphyromonadaceae bacterium]|nr:hypothetical protein [Porphyromonadaceae bacterium]